MGLILIPSEVMQRTENLSEIVPRIVEGYQNVLQTIRDFSSESELDTEAWNTLKIRVLDYHQNIAKGILAAADDMISDADTLQQSVGTEELYEDTLKDIIEKLEKEREECENQIQNLEMLRNGFWGGLLGETCSWIDRIIAMLQEEISRINQVIEFYKKKLQFLYDVNTSTQNLFETVDQLLAIVEMAIHDAGVEITGNGEMSDGNWKLQLNNAIMQIDKEIETYIGEALRIELNIELSKLKEMYGEEVINLMINVVKENELKRYEKDSLERCIEVILTYMTGDEVVKVGKRYMYQNEGGIRKELTVENIQKIFQRESEIIIYIKNLSESDLNIIHQKRKEMVIMSEVLLREGYECEFVAGILANIAAEGTAGAFESSNYINTEEPDYLVYMDKYFNYKEDFSGNNISDVGITKTWELICDLENSKGMGKFGLGCVQWTDNRTKELVNCYMEFCGENDYPTLEQCLQVESLFIARELNSTYKDVYENWKVMSIGEEPCQRAYRAGKVICEQYESPRTNSASDRAEFSEKIFNIMVGANEK